VPKIPKPAQVEVVLSNSESLPAVDVWLVVDVLRASTVIVNWFAAGGGELYPTDSVASARLLARRLRKKGMSLVLMGEQNAVAPKGFDLGNSPLDITEELVQENPCAVMATTNGTVAILKAASTGAPVLIACARNALAALSVAIHSGDSIGILCSGREGRPAWDDTLCAGLMVAQLIEHFPDIRLSEGARLAFLTWRDTENFTSSLKSAEHAIFLEKLGFGDDVSFAGEINATHVVPELCETSHSSIRVVLKPAVLDEQKFLTENKPLNNPIPSPLNIERDDDMQYPVIPPTIPQPAAWQKEGLPRHLPSASVERIFFAGVKYKKPRKTKMARYDRY